MSKNSWKEELVSPVELYQVAGIFVDDYEFIPTQDCEQNDFDKETCIEDIVNYQRRNPRSPIFKIAEGKPVVAEDYVNLTLANKEQNRSDYEMNVFFGHMVHDLILFTSTKKKYDKRLENLGKNLEGFLNTKFSERRNFPSKIRAAYKVYNFLNKTFPQIQTKKIFEFKEASDVWHPERIFVGGGIYVHTDAFAIGSDKTHTIIELKCGNPDKKRSYLNAHQIANMNKKIFFQIKLGLYALKHQLGLEENPTGLLYYLNSKGSQEVVLRDSDEQRIKDLVEKVNYVKNLRADLRERTLFLT